MSPERAGFDPDLYLANKQKFNPDAYLTAKAAQAPQVGAGETALNKAADAIPLGRQLVNILTTGGLQGLKALGLGAPGARLTPKAREEMRLMGILAPEERSAIPGALDTYRNVRDTFAERTAAGAEQNPLAATAGTLGGLALSLAAPLPKVALGGKTAGAGTRILNSALTGSAYGTATGAANSRGDLTKGEFGQVALDALGLPGLQQSYSAAKEGKLGTALLDLIGSGALGGGAAGGVLGAASEGLRASGVTQKVADYFKNRGLMSGRKVLTSGARQLSNLDPVSDAAVEAAIRERAIVPAGTTEGAYGRLQKAASEKGDEYGRIVASLEAKGVQGPEARKLATQFLEEGAARELTTGADKSIPKSYFAEAANAEAVAAGRERLGLTQAEKIKRHLQDQARYGTYEETLANKAQKHQASIYRQGVEEAIDEAAKARPELQPLASQFVPVKQKLGALLEAEEAARAGVARGAHRTGGGPDVKAGIAALATGQPALVAAGPLQRLLKARLPSTTATAGLGLSDLLNAPTTGGDAALIAELLGNAFRDDEKQKALALAKALGAGQ